VIDSLASLIWHANMASLELHTPQWRVAEAEPEGSPATMRRPDRLVVDLDPGPGAGLAECARVALEIRERLDLPLHPVTSGSKGLQLYAELPGDADSDAVREQARRLAEQLVRDLPDLVVATMTKSARTNRVFLDWSQNSASKTTITPWSMRGRDEPTVAVPRDWSEIEDGASLRQLRYDEALDRV
jgi:bifunctional non-homologous end joining protein LigD